MTGTRDGVSARRHTRLRSYRRKLTRAAQVVGVPSRPRFTPGPPPDVGIESVSQVCVQVTGSPLVAVRHQHSSGWKSSGAYRLELTAANGTIRQIFCKVNDHRPESIAGLRDFPVRVGPPEHVVLEAARTAIPGHVPQIYATAPMGHARTLIFMEALSPRWHSCTSWSRDLRAAAVAAAALHTALGRWFEESPSAALIRYDEDFSLKLNAYAHARLNRLAEVSADDLVAEVLNRWQELSGLYLPGSRAPTYQTVVHGDFNTANVYLHVTRRSVKVIDWEWAGIGDAYRDLAGLLKRAPRRTEAVALHAYHAALGGYPDWNRYERCQLERGLLDASYLAAQTEPESFRPRVDMSGFVRSSLRRALQAQVALTA